MDFLVVASSTLCNLLLEFSPSKEPILESGAIELLCQLTHRYDSALVLNGVWGLMNMAFRADQRIKVQIITTLGSDQIFRLLSDQVTHTKSITVISILLAEFKRSFIGPKTKNMDLLVGTKDKDIIHKKG